MIPTNNDYPSIKLNNEEIILIPGSRFSKMELRYRLKEMNIKDNNSQEKEYLNKLYDSSLKDHRNCLKIYQRLKQDTNNMNSKILKSQRQSMPPSNISENMIQNKMVNISYDVKNLYPNSREQKINLIKPIHTNKGKYVQNPFISSTNSINVNNSYNTRINNKEIKFNGFTSQNPENSYNMNQNIGMNVNNDIRIDNKGENINEKNKYLGNTYEYNFENNNNISDINKINNSSSFLSENNNLFKKRPSNPYEGINTDLNNNFNENKNKIYTNEYPYEEKIEIDEYNNNSQEPHNSYNEQNIPNYNNNSHNERPDINPEENNFKRYNKRLSFQPNSLKRDVYLNTNKNRKSYSNMPALININEIPFNSIMNNSKNNSTNLQGINNNIDNAQKTEEKIKDDKDGIKKDYDEVSTFSIFSAFDNFKKYPLYKNISFILIHLLILTAIILISIFLFSTISNSWDSITNFFSDIFDFFSEPKNIFETITSFFWTLIVGPINYWYITIPIILLIFVIYFFMRKYLFKKRCREILEQIVKDLNESENRRISEDDICRRYSQMYGISYNKFVKKYLAQIYKLRRNDNRLKLTSVNENEKEFIFWELNDE